MQANMNDLKAIDGIILTRGSHDPGEGMCAMEAVAFLAGEPHSDAPQCACPALAAFARRLNDGAWPSDVDRTEAMRPAVLALIGTRSTRATGRARAAYLVDCALRWYAPLALMAAVGACEARGIDCTGLRAAALRLCEDPTREHALMARAEAWKAYVDGGEAGAADAPAAAADAFTAAAAAADAAAADAAADADAGAAAGAAATFAAADVRLLILRLAVEHLLSACAITVPS